MKSSLSRRSLLRGIPLGAAAGLLGPAIQGFVSTAMGATPARRFFLFSAGNGWVHNGAEPSQVLNTTVRPDKSFDLPSVLTPLKPWHNKMTIAREFYNPHGHHINGLHGNGQSTLTCVASPPIPGSKYGSLPGGISIDRVIAKAIGASDPFDQVHVGLSVFGKLTGSVPSGSADGNQKPFPAIPTPLKAYETYFGKAVGKTPDQVQGLLSQDKSLLDDVCGDIQAVGLRLAGAEREKLDQLLESCRALERKVGTQTAPAAPAPTGGAGPKPITLNASGLRGDVIRAHGDVIANAFAFGVTHVAHLSVLGVDAFNDSFGGLLNIPGDAHENYSHNKIAGWSGSDYTAAMNRIASFYAGEIANIWTQLAAFKEGDKSMADNTLGMWLNSGGGKHHNGRSSHAIVLLGDLGGTVKSAGRFLTYPGKERSMADVFVTVAQAMGVKVDKFGDAELNKGPLTEIV
jgi:hypothetical protein